jgi:hypothetical protein
MRLKKIVFNENGLKYIKGELYRGKYYAKSILQRNKLEEGVIHTIIPPECVNDAEDFDDSILKPYEDLGGNPKEYRQKLITNVEQLIRDYIMNNNGCAIFEIFARSDSPILDRGNKKYFIFNKEAYLILFKNTDLKNEIHEYLPSARPYPEIIGLSSLSEHDIEYVEYQTVDEGMMKKLVETTDYLIIGAYDGEGYLIWEKTKK